jgi:DNA adenine methylase
MTKRALSATELTPLLRWAGGKRWLARSVMAVGEHVQPSSYLEPFAGGAATFFGATWANPVLCDVNGALIRCYQGLAQDPAAVRGKLEKLTVDGPTYRKVADWRPRSTTGEAARLLYLNRTAYGGIYRENKDGHFNVPFSGDRTLDLLLQGDRLERTAILLGRATLLHGDFELALSRARGRSLIYCDPPYSLSGGERGFRRYSRAPFQWSDQVRLAERLRGLARRGNTVIVSNSADEAVQGLYHEAQAVILSRKSPLAKRAHIEQKEALYVLHADPQVALLLSGVAAKVLA